MDFGEAIDGGFEKFGGGVGVPVEFPVGFCGAEAEVCAEIDDFDSELEEFFGDVCGGAVGEGEEGEGGAGGSDEFRFRQAEGERGSL